MSSSAKRTPERKLQVVLSVLRGEVSAAEAARRACPRALLLAVGERCAAVRGPRHLEDAVCVPGRASRAGCARAGRPCYRSSTN